MSRIPYGINYAEGTEGDYIAPPQLLAGETPALGTIDVLMPSGAVDQFVPLGTNYGPWAAGQVITGVTAYATPGGVRAAIYTSGCFNLDAIKWPSGTTEAQVQTAQINSQCKFRKLLYSDKRTGTEPAPGTEAGPSTT